MSKDKTVTFALTTTLQELEKGYIEHHILHGGHSDLRHLADVLGISRHALRRRITKHGIDVSLLKGGAS